MPAKRSWQLSSLELLSKRTLFSEPLSTNVFIWPVSVNCLGSITYSLFWYISCFQDVPNPFDASILLLYLLYKVLGNELAFYEGNWCGSIRSLDSSETRLRKKVLWLLLSLWTCLICKKMRKCSSEEMKTYGNDVLGKRSNGLLSQWEFTVS